MRQPKFTYSPMKPSFTYFKTGIGNSPELLARVSQLKGRGMFAIALSTRSPHLRTRNIKFHLQEPLYAEWFKALAPALEREGIRVEYIGYDKENTTTIEDTSEASETPVEDSNEEVPTESDGNDVQPQSENSEDLVDEEPADTEVPVNSEPVDTAEEDLTEATIYTATDRQSKPRDAGVYVHGPVGAQVAAEIAEYITENTVTAFDSDVVGDNVTEVNQPIEDWAAYRAIISDEETVVLQAIAQGIPVYTSIEAEGLAPFVESTIAGLLTAKVKKTQDRQTFLDSL